MCRSQIGLTLLTFRLDFEDQANIFGTQFIEHKILQIVIGATYPKIRGGLLIFIELSQKILKKVSF